MQDTLTVKLKDLVTWLNSTTGYVVAIFVIIACVGLFLYTSGRRHTAVSQQFDYSPDPHDD